MRESQFRRALAEEFGTEYSAVLIRDHWLQQFSGTAKEALERGESLQKVWLAICEDFDVPPERRHGRSLVDPNKT